MSRSGEQHLGLDSLLEKRRQRAVRRRARPPDGRQVLGGAQVVVSTYVSPIIGGLTIVVLAALILRIRPKGIVG